MEQEIVNRVAQSKLEIFDLEDFYPKNSFEIINIEDFLQDRFLLKEKEFRQKIEEVSFEFLKGKIVLIQISEEIIIPKWASILLASKISLFANEVFFGKKQDFLISYYTKKLSCFDFSPFELKSVILKGCSKYEIPEAVMVLAVSYLQKYAKKIHYGEACSSVPIFKK